MVKITDKLNIIKNAKDDIKASIEAKGVSVGNVSIEEYSSKIDQIVGTSDEQLNVTPSAEEQVYVGQYGKVVVAGDSNLIAENIKDGVSIFGVTGTVEGSWDTSVIRSCYSLFDTNQTLVVSPKLNTVNVSSFSNMYSYCTALTTVYDLDMSKAKNIYSMFTWCNNLVNLGKLINLGKNFTTQRENYDNFTLDLGIATKLSHESLMNVINSIYDLNLTYNVANGGTLYTQKLNLGATNLAKLSAEEIAICTAKGWTVS